MQSPTSVRAAASTPHRPTLPSPAWLFVVLALAAVLVAVPPPPPAAGQAVEVHSPTPAPHAVVEAGVHPVGAVVEGAGGDVQILLDGAPVTGTTSRDPLGRTIAEVSLTPGRHLVALHVDGTSRREWPVVVGDVRTQVLGADPLTVGLAASGPDAPGRPVLLVNPDTPSLSLAAGPLGSATGAVLLPTGQAELPAATTEALQRLEADRVMLLGGLDAIGPEVESALTSGGFTVQRVGTGGPADVAAAAALRAPVVPLYLRDGAPLMRPVLFAPAQPTTTALQAAIQGARRGASLLLVEGEGLTATTTAAMADRTLIWLAPSLSPEAASAVRAAAPDEAEVGPLPPTTGASGDAAPGDGSPSGGAPGDGSSNGGTPADGAPAAGAPAPATHEAVDRLWIVDADDPSAVVAARAAGPGTDVVLGREAGQAAVAHLRPPAVTVVGDVADAPSVLAWSVDGPDAPAVTARLTTPASPGDPAPSLVLDVDRTPQASAVHVTVAGREWPGTITTQAQTTTWRAGPRPVLPADLEPTEATELPLVVTAVVAADDAERHLHLTDTATVGPASSTSPEGFLVAGGSSPVVGSGPLRTFTIEIEPATGLDLAAVTAEATAILLDPDRGWTARGQRSMQRVADPAQANIRVVVARPATVDAWCGRVGLGTGGRLSCWDGRRAMLNLTRWNTGVTPFHTDLTVYRRYLVSHEVGHGLGFSHVGCPGGGALAPVMMQQSKGLGGCVANGWPYPDG